MTSKDELVQDGVVRVAASLFPAEVQLDSAGATGCRVLIMQHPNAADWYVGAWTSSPVGGEPVQIVLEKIDTIVHYASARMHFALASGRQMLVTPGRGCGSCGGGASLRMYNPFGYAVSLSRVPQPA